MRPSRFTEEQIIGMLKALVNLWGGFPLRPASYDVIGADVALSKEETMSGVHILAIDLAKRSF